MESFVHSLKAEVVHGARFATEAAVRHSALGCRSPVDFEARAA